MNRAAAGLLLFAVVLGPALAQEQPPARPEDPLLMQRRLAMVLRQSTKHYEAEQYQAALDRLDVLQGPAAQDLSVLNLRGAILTKMGRYQEALDLFNAILATDRNYFPAAFNLGEVQFLSGDVEGSLETFQRMRRRDPRNELVRFKVLVCLLKLNRDDEAKRIADGLIPAGGTPAWYYAQAMIARKAGDEKTAQKHLAAARSIYLDAGCKLFDESIAPVKL
jgi:tetratricopeptide (TPR) repeat protein